MWPQVPPTRRHRGPSGAGPRQSARSARRPLPAGGPDRSRRGGRAPRGPPRRAPPHRSPLPRHRTHRRRPGSPARRRTASPRPAGPPRAPLRPPPRRSRTGWDGQRPPPSPWRQRPRPDPRLARTSRRRQHRDRGRGSGGGSPPPHRERDRSDGGGATASPPAAHGTPPGGHPSPCWPCGRRPTGAHPDRELPARRGGMRRPPRRWARRGCPRPRRRGHRPATAGRSRSPPPGTGQAPRAGDRPCAPPRPGAWRAGCCRARSRPAGLRGGLRVRSKRSHPASRCGHG